MAEYRGKSRQSDHIYQKNKIDNPPMEVDVRKSILELRRIYKEKTNEEFARWYWRKYKIPRDTVLRVIKENDNGILP
jgi:hypothetical protein